MWAMCQKIARSGRYRMCPIKLSLSHRHPAATSGTPSQNLPRSAQPVPPAPPLPAPSVAHRPVRALPSPSPVLPPAQEKTLLRAPPPLAPRQLAPLRQGTREARSRPRHDAAGR